jgi:hypothetical protein
MAVALLTGLTRFGVVLVCVCWLDWRCWFEKYGVAGVYAELGACW